MYLIINALSLFCITVDVLELLDRESADIAIASFQIALSQRDSVMKGKQVRTCMYQYMYDTYCGLVTK